MEAMDLTTMVTLLNSSLISFYSSFVVFLELCTCLRIVNVYNIIQYKIKVLYIYVLILSIDKLHIILQTTL